MYLKNIFDISIKIVILFITIFFIHSNHQLTSEYKGERRPKMCSESSKSLGKTSDSVLLLAVLP